MSKKRPPPWFWNGDVLAQVVVVVVLLAALFARRRGRGRLILPYGNTEVEAAPDGALPSALWATAPP